MFSKKSKKSKALPPKASQEQVPGYEPPGQQPPPSMYDGPRASEASVEKTAKVQSEVDEVTGIMSKNVDSMLERGENLNDLSSKTAQLQVSSQQFSKNATAVKKKLWWKNMKMGIIVASIILLLIIALVAYGVISSKKKKGD